MDDILKAVPKTKAEELKKLFHSYNEHIQFTVDPEINQCIPFLEDVGTLRLITLQEERSNIAYRKERQSFY